MTDRQTDRQRDRQTSCNNTVCATHRNKALDKS